MKSNQKTSQILRIILGLFLIVYALNKFFHFLPAGYGSMPELSKEFLDGVATYLPALYLFEIILGILLILNKWTSAILLVLFPLTVTFLIFSISNGDLTEALPAVFVALLNVLLMWERRELYRPLLD